MSGARNSTKEYRMGDFRIVVEAMGGHGCMREVGDGQTVIGCNRPGCPDCIAREFVRRLQRSGAQIHQANLVHWPADFINPHTDAPAGYTIENQVRDNLVTGKRYGSFAEAKPAVPSKAP